MNQYQHIALATLTAAFISGCGGNDDNKHSTNKKHDNNNAGINPVLVDPSQKKNDIFDNIHAANPGATYTSVIKSCATDYSPDLDLGIPEDRKIEDISPEILKNASDKLKNVVCTLDTLPPLGMEVEDPTVDDIMNRTFVSHTWMANRFKTLLESYPPALLTLFKSVTAVIIDDNLNVAYFIPATGAIFIKPEYLWMTPAEKKTLQPEVAAPGSESELGLAFMVVGDYYTSTGKQVGNMSYMDGPSMRTLEDARISTASVLLHELAHANDFYSTDTIDQFDTTLNLFDNFISIVPDTLSDQLYNWRPLEYPLWTELSKTLYEDHPASVTALTTDGVEAGMEFEANAAADPYGFTSQEEDLATLFETVMMKYFFNVDYRMQFVDDNAFAMDGCVHLSAEWGVQGWIGDVDVKERAQFVTSEILPDVDMSLFYQDLPPPSFDVPNTYKYCGDEKATDSTRQKSVQNSYTPNRPRVTYIPR